MAKAQDGICTWCKLPLPEDLEAGDVVNDHIIPRSRGGPESSWNRQVLHKRCNGPSGKGSKLTPEAERLAALHGIQLREPLPTSWPGSSVVGGSGKPNPYRALAGQPLPEVTIRKVYEVECATCRTVISAETSWEAAMQVKHDHQVERHEPAA